jgi:hypothetical protein
MLCSCGCGDWRGGRASVLNLFSLFRGVRLAGRKMLADQFGMMQINRTGMGLLVGNSDFGEIVEHRFGFYFQLAGQLVNAYLIWVRHL